MQIWISSPLGAQLGGLANRLRDSWRMAAKYASADLHFVEPRRNEIHGELLSRLWITEIAQHEDRQHLISELDFQPYRSGPAWIRDAAARSHFNLVYAPYITRNYSANDDVTKTPGVVTEYGEGLSNLLGPWAVYLDLSHPRAGHLGDDIFAASGQFNDCGNLLLARAAEAKFLTTTPRNFASLKYQDAWPLFHGAIYPRLGRHFFFARALDQPDDDVICWSHCRRPLTAGYHRQNVRRSCR